jgi:hypothetical protein
MLPATIGGARRSNACGLPYSARMMWPRFDSDGHTTAAMRINHAQLS